MPEDRVALEIRDALRRIADALERACPPALDEPPADAAAPKPPCPHPLDARQDFGVTDGVEDWRCGDCGHRSVSDEALEAVHG